METNNFANCLEKKITTADNTLETTIPYFNANFRSFGNTMFQAVAMLVSTLLNAILDHIFINIIGFHGAAIATLISQIICLAFMCIYIYRKKLFNLSLSDFDTKEIMPFVKNAVPSVIQQSIPAISTTFLTAIVSTYSISAIALRLKSTQY